MLLPSGDHTGSRSMTAGLLVRLRGSPFSAGTVRISPRASNTARAPVGEISAFRSRLATFDEMRPHFRQIARQRHRHRLGLAGFQIVEVQRAELLVDDGARTGRCRFEIQPVVLDGARDLVRLGVVVEQRHRALRGRRGNRCGRRSTWG